MSTLDIMTTLAYSLVLIGVLGSKTDMGKIKWMLWAIIILLAQIVGKLTP
jgi:hypothetical protein